MLREDLRRNEDYSDYINEKSLFVSTFRKWNVSDSNLTMTSPKISSHLLFPELAVAAVSCSLLSPESFVVPAAPDFASEMATQTAA